MVRSLCQAIQPTPSAATEGRRKIIFPSSTPDSATQAAEGLLFKDTPLGRLPSELLHGVFAAAGRTDIPNLRLACKTLRDIGSEHLLKDITLLFNSKSFNRVAKVSKLPLFGKTVQSLQYRIDSLRSCRPVDIHKAHFPNFDMRTTAFVRRTRQGLAIGKE